MNPGRYPNLSNAEYHASPGISKSGLDQIAKSPAHYQAYLKAKQAGESEDSKALRIGSAFHSLVLEAEKFDSEFAIMPECDGRTKEGKAIKASFEVASRGKTILTADERDVCKSMADAVRVHPLSSALLDSEGEAETSFYWINDLGILCKCRPDYLTSSGYIVDYKSAEDASPEGFERACERYRYYVQAAHYKEGVEAVLGINVEGFVFVAVEKEPPFAVACYLASDDVLIGGKLEARRCLNIYKNCLTKNEWPGYPDGLIPLSRPRWAA